jgi:hypothetical protein
MKIQVSYKIYFYNYSKIKSNPIEMIKVGVELSEFIPIIMVLLLTSGLQNKIDSRFVLDDVFISRGQYHLFFFFAN